MMPQPIVIADPDPMWREMYEREASRLADAFGDVMVDIQHIGSTSVPGLAAKPIIDIMPGLRSRDKARACIPAIQDLGYRYVPDYEDALPERLYFAMTDEEARRAGLETGVGYHVHSVETTTRFWVRHLLFRDYLREFSDARDDYASLKRQLAAVYGPDRGGYTDAKTSFIERIVEQASTYYEIELPVA